MDEHLQLPENLAEVSDEQLGELQNASDTLLAKIKQRDAELVGELSAKDLLDFTKRAAERHVVIRGEQQRRLSEAKTTEEVDAILDEALAEADQQQQAEQQSAPQQVPEQPAEPAPQQPAQPAPAQPAAPQQPAPAQPQQPAQPAQQPAQEQPAAVAASAPPTLPQPTKQHEPRPVRRAGRVTITAGADIGGIPVGHPLEDLHEVSQAMLKRSQALGWGRDKKPISEAKFREMESNPEDLGVATFDWSENYPEDRILTTDAGSNMEKIEAVTAALSTPDALTAAGGLCAPFEPRYGLETISGAQRPVRDSLPSFNATRGGINFATPPTLAAISTAVGVITAANDASATPADYTKTCQAIACQSFQTANVDIVYHCLQIANLTARTWPELVEAYTQLMMAAFARQSEVRLLDAIKAGSTAITAGRVLGSMSDVLAALIVEAEGFRSRHRTTEDFPMRVLLPEWIREEVAIDVLRGQFDRFQFADRSLDAMLARFNIRTSYYQDGPSAGTGQVFGAQGTGALLAFPAVKQIFMFPEGTWLFLDGGQLELGLVRDSALNAINRYQMFGEAFEGLAKVGIESHFLALTTDDNGRVSAPVAITPPAAY